MELRTILVNMDIADFSGEIVGCAVDLARRFGGRVIGQSSAQPTPAIASFEGGAFVGEIYQEERREIEEALGKLEARFRALVPREVEVEWRGTVDPPNFSVIAAARCADLVLTRSRLGGLDRNAYHSLDLGEALVSLGRPVLIPGTGRTEIPAKRILVGWKDTKEARRAVVDALPFLKHADEVIVATVHEGDLATEKAGLTDVLSWMKRHEVPARGDVFPATDGMATSVLDIARKEGPDLIVTGAYGHSRLSEWLLSGVTRELLLDDGFSRFMSN